MPPVPDLDRRVHAANVDRIGRRPQPAVSPEHSASVTNTCIVVASAYPQAMAAKAKLVIPDQWFNRVVFGAIALGFAALVAAGIAASLAVNANQTQSAWVRHTYDVQNAIQTVQVLTDRVETARRGLLMRHDPRMLGVFRQTVDQTLPAIDRVRRLTADNPRQQRNIARAREMAVRHLALQRRSVEMAEQGQRAAAIAAFQSDPGLDLLFARRANDRAMMDEEGRLLVVRNADRAASARLFYIILAVSGVLLLIVALASLWAILRYTRDLTASRNRLRVLNEGLEGAVRERTTDLQRANDEIQRFAYIVSHDLRSPLVNVMGFTAELEAATKTLGELVDKALEERPDTVDPRAIEAIRRDLPEATGFIRTSTQKMDRLINAILRLSREGRRTVMPERLDMVAMSQGIADSLYQRAHAADAEIAIEAPMPGIVSDRLGVEQILSNLVENAVKYLKPGVPGRVRVRGHRQGERAVFEVIDNGRGIDPRDHERVFDLFRRSGVQDQPGEGIGLAHVRAMAYRLGGTVGVKSTLGEGATFQLTLPLRFAGEGASK